MAKIQRAIKEVLEALGEASTEIQALAKRSADWKAEDKERWEKINKAYDELRDEKEAYEQQTEIESRAASVADYKNELATRFGTDPDDTAGDDDAITDNDRSLALGAWANPGGMSERQSRACQKMGFNPGRSDIKLAIPGDPYAANGWSAPSKARQLQSIYRSNHESIAGMRIEEWRQSQFELAQKRALSAGTATKGLETVPEGFVNQLEISLLAFGGMMQVSDIMDTASGNDLPWPTANDTANEGEIIGEAATIGTSVDPVFGSLTFNAFKFSSKLIQVSFELTEDSAFNIETILAQMIGERIGRHGNNKFTVGTGSGEPNGIITAANTGVTTATGAAILDTELLDLVHSVDPAYRIGAGVRFMMHDNIALAIRKLKDSEARFVWQPGLSLGTPDRLLGYPVTINQHMASAVAVNNKTIVFGDLTKYKIRRVRSIRLRRLAELYAANDQIGFIGFIRMDGDLLDAGTDPVKLMVQNAV